MNKFLVLLGVILILVTGAAAVGLLDTSSTSVTSSVPVGTTATTVPIKSFMFTPAKLAVRVGTKVTFTNHDSAEHTATADQGSFDSGTLTQNQSKTITFATAGTFAYHCVFHPFMVATVTVS